MEKLDYLIHYLLTENKEITINEIPINQEDITINEIPINQEDKKRLYRSLCNTRNPKPIEEEYIRIEKEYLQEELQKKEITKIGNIKTVQDIFPNTSLKHKDKICLWKGDITELEIDAGVNAGNSQGLGCFIPCHKCIDNQIQTYAGLALRLECNEIMKEKNYFLPTGEVFITKGYNLPVKFIIHTVGPIIQDMVTKKQEEQLANCYIHVLELARKKKIKTIAFPCISTGEFRFPKDKACILAIRAVENYLEQQKNAFEKIVFNVYGEEDYKIYEKNIQNWEVK